MLDPEKARALAWARVPGMVPGGEPKLQLPGVFVFLAISTVLRSSTESAHELEAHALGGARGAWEYLALTRYGRHFFNEAIAGFNEAMAGCFAVALSLLQLESS